MCKECLKAINDKYHGIYQLKCARCRHRLLMNESCKISRKEMAESLKKYGDVAEWQVEPSCGCQFRCKRYDAIRTRYANS